MKLANHQIYGHRGIAGHAPENTLGGFKAMIAAGVQNVEIDVSMLGDGTPVVIHDDTLDRCSDRSGPLKDLQLKDLKGINNAVLFPDWPAEPVPTLEQTIALFNEHEIGLNLEIKAHQSDLQVLANNVLALVLSQYAYLDRLVVSSFNTELLHHCRAFSDSVRLGCLFDVVPMNWQKQAEAVNAQSIHVNWKHLTPIQLQAIKAKGYQVFVYTANDPQALKDLWRYGLDVVISDFPERFF